VKVAIVHDWLTTLGGAELVLRELLRVYPDAHVFTLVDAMAADDRQFIGVGRVTTSLLDVVPGVARHYRSLLPLFPLATRSIDVGAYDVVLSNSHAVAKNIRTHKRQMHLCYCLSPMRYAWDLREQYLAESGLSSGVRGVAARSMLNSLQRWDRNRSADVDVFATLSRYIGDRIQRAYDRSATVIYPPVDVEFFTPGAGDPTLGEYYVTVSRFVPYKRVDLIARAFASLPDRRLIIVGDGPDAEKVRAAAGPNVSLVGRASRARVRALLRGARGFLFAAEEDFGIAPVEAQACGIPVIAYGRGGVLETIHGAETGEPTGVFFAEQTTDAIARAVRELEQLPVPASVSACRANAERFSEARFRREFAALVEQEWRAFAAGESPAPS
jgi:glycosyltransferase involved in cell wall biosynthesis